MGRLSKGFKGYARHRKLLLRDPLAIQWTAANVSRFPEQARARHDTRVPSLVREDLG